MLNHSMIWNVVFIYIETPEKLKTSEGIILSLSASWGVFSTHRTNSVGKDIMRFLPHSVVGSECTFDHHQLVLVMIGQVFFVQPSLF